MTRTPYAILAEALEYIATDPAVPGLRPADIASHALAAAREATPPEPSGNPGELHAPELCARKGCGKPRDARIHCPMGHRFVPPAPKCATCGGSGRRVYGSSTGLLGDCDKCNGTGRAKEK